ncbi:MAG TPA: 2-dehydropantoate 2-reductase [Candidatus Binatia bacterium]|nr:2-dehydropantoate 2-reductase [Candidatus Binatia bacterium]
MRIVVMGAGAVGGYFGAKLAAAGHKVAFIARGKHLEALRRGGLRINSPGGALHIQNALFTDDPARTDSADLILLCVKSYDTELAARALEPITREKTAILSLQNGIDNPEKIAQRFGAHRTLAGVVYVGAQVVAPGVIEHSSGGRIILGPLGGGRSQAAKEVHETIAASAIPCEISSDIKSALWRKLLWNAPFCAISCLTGASVGSILGSKSLSTLAIDCMEEVRQAAQTCKVELPSRLIDEILEFSKTLGDFKPSMLQDLQAGKPLEYEAFNGIVVRVLGAAGKDAPVNNVFYRTLKYMDRKIRQEAFSYHHA